MKKIVLFASGSGSNVENIITYFKGNDNVQVLFVVTNKRDAFVVERAKRNHVPLLYVDRELFYKHTCIADILEINDVDMIVLAGFLWLIPEYLVQRFPKRIINIHPALLPKYGGKGMYGGCVHKAVRENNDTETGITIHYVNEVYDAGQIIFQTSCDVHRNETPEQIAEKVQALEYQHYPRVIESLL